MTYTLARVGFVGAQAAQRAAATAAAVPAVRLHSLHLGAPPRRLAQSRDGGVTDASGAAEAGTATLGSQRLRRRDPSVAAFSDRQQPPAVDGPASRSNGDPGATTSAGAASNGATAPLPLATGSGADAHIAALRAELDSLRQIVSTQGAAAQQQFMSLATLERKVLVAGSAVAPLHQQTGDQIVTAISPLRKEKDL